MIRHKISALNPHPSLGVESGSCHLTHQARVLVAELECHGEGENEGDATTATVPSVVAELPLVPIPTPEISSLLVKIFGI